MELKEWLAEFLRENGLSQPDQRALYQYRFGESGLQILGEILKKSFDPEKIGGLSNQNWSAAFVLYAAEWWRRYYMGDWGWESVFSALDIDSEQIKVQDRNAMVEMGLLYWGRKVRWHNRRRKFLGSIAAEGGLPLQQFSKNSGWLRQVLLTVVSRYTLYKSDLIQLVDDNDDFIPQAYRSYEIKQLIADVARNIYNLVYENKLDQQAEPVLYLDEKQPDWRDSFPLPVNDQVAVSLLKILVNSASDSLKKNDSQQLRVQRYLKITDTNSFELIARIEMPGFYPITRLDERLNSVARFDVVVYLSGGVERYWCKALICEQNGQKGIRLLGKPLELDHTDACKKISLGFVVHGGCIAREEIVGAEALDINIPWLFAKKDERYELYSTASQSLKNEHVLIYAPENFEINPLDVICKKCDFLDGSLYKLNGNVICKSDDLQFKFSNQRQASLNQFSLSGRMCSYALEPEDVFIGVPDLFRIDGQCRTYKLLGRPFGKKSDFKKLSKADYGYYETRVTDEEGNILFRRKIGILPEGFQLKPKVLNSTHGDHKGRIEIAGILYNQLTVQDRRDGLQYEITKRNGNLFLNFESRRAIPRRIHCALQLIDQNKKIMLGLPFPVRGAVLYDDAGKQVKDREEFCMRELAGYRLVIYEPKPESNRTIPIDFELKESGSSAQKLSFYYNYKFNQHLNEIAVYHWKDEIQELLGISTSLDAKVEISYRDSGQVTKIMHVARYQYELHADWCSGEISLNDVTRRLSTEEVNQIKISALSLSQPDTSIALLDKISTEDVSAAKWLFHYQNAIAGPWLIYPAEDSSLSFRPFLWNVGPSQKVYSVSDRQTKTLSQAVSIENEEQRLKAIKLILQEMSADFRHNGWLYLRDLWEHSDHIPLSTFDVWKQAVQQPKLLACLVVQKEELMIDVEQLSKELPVVWELVPLNAWQQAVKMLSDKLLFSGLDADSEFYVCIIKDAFKNIKSLGSSMDFIVSQMKSKLLKRPANAMQITKQQVEYLVKEKYQELLQSKQDEWPQQLHAQILTTLKGCAIDDVLKFEGVKERQVVVYLPMVLAYIAVHGIEHGFLNPRSLFYIRKIKAFNPQWFEFIYNLYLGWFDYQKES